MRIHEQIGWSFSGSVAWVIEENYDGDLTLALVLPTILAAIEFAFIDTAARVAREGNLVSALIGVALSLIFGYWLLVILAATITFLRTERSALEPVSAVTEMIR